MILLSEHEKLLYGFENDALISVEINHQTITLHQDVVSPLKNLLERLASTGLETQIVSHWRSFERQAQIWQSKWTGQRDILDPSGKPLPFDNLNEHEKFNAICFWSALPGTSRHHWGTDFDIFLKAPIEQGYSVELIQSEFDKEGPCDALNHWLNQHEPIEGFSRPYKKNRGGVCPEPWHISYRPIADTLMNDLNEKTLQNLIASNPRLDHTVINPFVSDYLSRYVFNID